MDIERINEAVSPEFSERWIAQYKDAVETAAEQRFSVASREAFASMKLLTKYHQF